MYGVFISIGYKSQRWEMGIGKHVLYTVTLIDMHLTNLMTIATDSLIDRYIYYPKPISSQYNMPHKKY